MIRAEPVRYGGLRARLDAWGRGPVSVVVGGSLLAATLVAFSLRAAPEVASYPVTVGAPAEVGGALVGPRVYTVDAAAEATWVRFDFSRGGVVPADDPLGWDLAIRRFALLANGGVGYAGVGGVVDLGQVPFGTVREAPAVGYEGSVVEPDSANPALARWYSYGWTTHLLTPKPHVYAVRTADGRYAKIEILGYYCPGPRPGCLTFRYVYQGDGSRSLEAPVLDRSPADSAAWVPTPH